MIDASDAYGVVEHSKIVRKNDYLFRVSLKALVVNDKGEILIVKEVGRDLWDIPGGGMDHGETIKDAIRRELAEEVSLQGDFSYTIILAEDPTFVENISIWQMRIIVVVKPENTSFSPGQDGDEIRFVHPETLKESAISTEKVIYDYSQVAHTLGII